MGLEYTTKLLVHGTILDNEGKKMSKSVGNVIDPLDQVSKHGLDAVRYYTLAGLSTTENAKWDENELKNRFNSEICNDWGNLVSRVLHLVDTKLNGEVEQPADDFYNFLNTRFKGIDKSWYELNVKDALSQTNKIVGFANIYINENKPWSETDPAKVKEILSNLYYLIQVISYFYHPVFPHKRELVDKAITDKKKVILFEKLQ